MRTRVLVSTYLDVHHHTGGFAIINGVPFLIHDLTELEFEFQTELSSKMWVERCQMKDIPTWEVFTAWFEYEGPGTDEFGQPIDVTLAVARILFEHEWHRDYPMQIATLPPGEVTRLAHAE